MDMKLFFSNIIFLCICRMLGKFKTKMKFTCIEGLQKKRNKKSVAIKPNWSKCAIIRWDCLIDKKDFMPVIRDIVENSNFNPSPEWNLNSPRHSLSGTTNVFVRSSND